jgi:hypothetical protein
MTASPFEEKTLAMWLGWLDRIDLELVVMHMNRKIWKETIEMMRGNDHVRQTGAFFADFLTRIYVDAQAMRVRRQAEISKGVVSLARLIESLQGNPQILTKERHLALYSEKYPDNPVMAVAAEAEFASLWGEEATQVGPEALAVDLERLRSVVDPVKDFADKHVAHLDYTPVEKMPTFDELDQAIDSFGVLFSKYYLVLTGSSKGVSATIVDDWLAPFRVPWT